MTTRRAFRASLVLGAAVRLLTAAPLHAQDSTGARTIPPVDFHGFVQVYYRAGDPTNNDGFRLRKGDIKFSGDLSPHLSWRVALDVAKTIGVTKTPAKGADSLALGDVAIDQKTRMLQDAALTYTVSRTLQFDVGQQNLPLSEEGWISLANLETIERTLFITDKSRAEGMGFVYDIGASANGVLGKVLEYHTGLFNEPGDAQGTTDPNEQKTVIGRFVVHPPFISKLQFGGSGAYEGGPVLQHRERAGGELQYRDAKFTVRGEAMGGRDGLLHRFGWYGLGAVRPMPRLQLVARYDNWDRDTGAERTLANALERQVVLGGSWVLEGTTNSKFALNVVRQTFPNITTVRASTFLLAAFQAAW